MLPDCSMEGEHVLVTGGGKGIGKAIAEAFAEEGADISIFDVDMDAAESTADDLETHGVDVVAETTDVSVEEMVIESLDNVVSRLGPVTILVNNAGVQIPASLLETTEETWDKQLDTNAKGTFLCSKHVGQQMVDNGISGSIINLSSRVGKIPSAHQGAYATSKAGIIALTQTLALELASDNIRVNAICPGTIQTPMLEEWKQDYAAEEGKTVEELQDWLESDIPLGRIGRPEDIANVTLFLASPLSAYITGQALTVSGGKLLV